RTWTSSTTLSKSPREAPCSSNLSRGFVSGKVRPTGRNCLKPLSGLARRLRGLLMQWIIG
ncbi:MAG: hypothetical protein VX936_09830, partial [Planctomycetota bacterium]|nr:hypothetical protein [Planctomycetota bacterium]